MKSPIFPTALCSIALALPSHAAETEDQRPPNILILISDDQSFPHASAYGSKMVSTPNFDRIAFEGVLFTNAFAGAPGCSPSRAAFLTGRQIWQIEHAGTHASSFGSEYLTFPQLLAEAGYHTGHVGKGWGPGNWRISGRAENPAGPGYGGHQNYAASFERFLSERPDDAPFLFWFGSKDPHRSYQKGSGVAAGKTLDQAEVPPFLPDSPDIREDLLDYAHLIERFDRDCGRILELLEQTGEYDNTIIIVTSDQGMPFPYAKANCNEFGLHVPMAVSWKARVPGGRVTDRLVSQIDFTATIHEATGIKAPDDLPLSGVSQLGFLLGDEETPGAAAVYAGSERHSSSRYMSLGYPQRFLRTQTHVYVRNLTPERWPAGPGQRHQRGPDSPLTGEHPGYHDIDNSPSLQFLIKHREDPEVARFFHLATGHRPAEALFDITTDPGCTNNLADDPQHAELKAGLANKLDDYLRSTGDPRVTGDGDIFETYPRYSPIRWFPKPDWAIENPDSVPPVPWLEDVEVD